jgi:hypothetical protein
MRAKWRAPRPQKILAFFFPLTPGCRYPLLADGAGTFTKLDGAKSLSLAHQGGAGQ